MSWIVADDMIRYPETLAERRLPDAASVREPVGRGVDAAVGRGEGRG